MAPAWQAGSLLVLPPGKPYIKRQVLTSSEEKSGESFRAKAKFSESIRMGELRMYKKHTQCSREGRSDRSQGGVWLGGAVGWGKIEGERT